MVTLKYVGKGLMSRGIYFTPDKNDGLYDVKEEFANYLLNTFKNDFILIEKKSNTIKVTKSEETKPRRQTRRVNKKTKE